MPIYEFRCSECDALFEERRPASRLDDPAPACPSGHGQTRRVLSLFASVGSTGATSPATSSAPAAGGCGAGCACSCGA